MDSMKLTKRILSVLLACILFAGPSTVFAADLPEMPGTTYAAPMPEANYAEDRVLVKLAVLGGGMGINSITPAAQPLNLGGGISEMRLLNPSKEGELSIQSANSTQNNVYVLTLEETGPGAVERALEILNANPMVEIAEPDYIYELCASPNDPMYSTQWALQTINAEQAWDITTGSKNVVVGIIDTGIEGTHPDLIDNLWVNPNPNKNGYTNDMHGYNFTGKVGGIPTDTNGHGTHVAGIVGAKGNNGQGVSGVNWNVSLAWLGVHGGGNSIDTAACIEALNYANNHNIQITNNSYGGDDYSRIFEEAVRNYKGLFIAAAGNDSSDNDAYPQYPANFNSPNIISVASTDQGDTMSGFSNNGKNTVHIAAPGGSIWNTYLNGGYSSLSGTSMASPYVAGVAALVLANNPGYTTAQVKAAVLDGAEMLPQYVDDIVSGRRLNAYRALVPWQAVQSVSIAPGSLTLDIAESGRLTANILPAGAQQGVSWTSSDPSTIMVFWDGTVTGLKPGTATITARSLANPARSASATVTVTNIQSGAIVFDDVNFKQGVVQALRGISSMYSGYSTASNIYPADAQKITSLYLFRRNIAGMEGIQYFTELQNLYCQGNRLTSLDVRQCAELETLICFGNQLTSLDVSQNPALYELYCSNNQLTSLDVRQSPELLRLSCFNNQLTSLDVSRNTKLLSLVCGSNQLKGLDVRQCAELLDLWCDGNLLKSLDVSQNSKLIQLICDDNRKR